MPVKTKVQPTAWGWADMKTRIRHERGQIKLVIDDPAIPKDEQDALAAMSLLEGTGCWRLVDVRLTKHHVPGIGITSLGAEVYRASFKPETPENAEYAKSFLREYEEKPDGTLMWCTFDGVVRGAPEVKGYRPVHWANFDQAGYFSRADALAELKKIQEFWDDIESLDSDWRIKNPHRQPDWSDIRFAVRYRDDSLIIADMKKDQESSDEEGPRSA
jgi:hypothetical protein